MMPVRLLLHLDFTLLLLFLLLPFLFLFLLFLVRVGLTALPRFLILALLIVSFLLKSLRNFIYKRILYTRRYHFRCSMVLLFYTFLKKSL